MENVYFERHVKSLIQNLENLKGCLYHFMGGFVIIRLEFLERL